MKTLVLAALGYVMVSASPAAAQAWRVIGVTGEEGDRVVYLADEQSVRRSGNTVTFLSQTIVEKPTNATDFDRSVTTREGDCAAYSGRITNNKFYRDGSMIGESTNAQAVVNFVPGSIMQSVLKAVCGQQDYVTGPIGDPEMVIRAYFKGD